AQQKSGEAEPSSLTTRKHGDRLLDMRFAKQQGAGGFEDLLIFLAENRLLMEVFQNGFVLRQAGVDMLGVNADLAAVAPADIARQRLERVHHRAEECRFALAVIADDSRPRAVVDLQVDVGGDLPFWITDCQIETTQSRAFARHDPWRPNPCGRLI